MKLEIDRPFLIISTFPNLEDAVEIRKADVGYLVIVIYNDLFMKWNARLIDICSLIWHYFKVDLLELQLITFHCMTNSNYLSLLLCRYLLFLLFGFILVIFTIEGQKNVYDEYYKQNADKKNNHN